MKLLRLLPRFRAAYRQLDALAERETWPRERIEALQLERLNSVWRHAIAHVPHYRGLRNRLDLPDEFGSLQEFTATVPVLTKPEHRERTASFLSERPARGKWRLTSGSTGAPASYFWDHASHREVLQARYRMYAAWDVDILDRSAFLWGQCHFLERGLSGGMSRWRQRAGDWLRGRLRLSAYHLGPQDLRQALQRLRKFQPAMLYGYASSIFLLSQEAAREGFDSNFLKLVVLTSEIIRPRTRAAVERAFGVPTIAEYGAAECNLIAGEAPDRTLRVREDVVLVETPRRDDDRHDIVVTVLGNPSFPLLRYAIGDVTDRPLELPDRGFGILHNVAGRDDDLLIAGDGRVIHSFLVAAVFEQEIHSVRCFHIHQRADGAVHVQLEPKEEFSEADLRTCRTRIRELIDGFPVEIEVVPRIPLSPGGKLRAATSEMVSRGVS